MTQMTRRVTSWLLLSAAGVFSFFLSAMGRLAFAYGYRPEMHSRMMFIAYAQGELIFPCFLIALIPHAWATIPLWLICFSVAGFPFSNDAKLRQFLGYSNAPFGLRDAKDILLIMLIPCLVQFAVWLKSRGGKVTEESPRLD